jgi:hypothetical protein
MLHLQFLEDTVPGMNLNEGLDARYLFDAPRCTLMSLKDAWYLHSTMMRSGSTREQISRFLSTF